ncbi:glycosyltransferase family 2 protein [Vulgatibacter sp.]|uniref:glycosyltransferase family 2 protein n=1 Tax=Vulgatibacter sp. TaxID=1971226 RepID=UPI0035645E03
MRIGGFVIHGNNADTLPRCLDSLASVCDEVVAVDSCSTDGSAQIARAAGARHVVVPWQGYGFARAAAAAQLAACDFIFFLDSDEWLAEGAVEDFARFRTSRPTLPHYRLERRDWAELPGHRFVYRSERHVRLVRREAATWTPQMVVHEALPRRESSSMGAVIEHRFATSVEELVSKQDRYALLWAIRANAEGKRPKSTLLQRPAHLVRDCVIKGGLFRGGVDALRLGWGVSRYHVRKHELLREVERGEHAEAVRAFADGRFADLFR